MRIFKFFKNSWPVVVLFLLETVLFFKNYQVNTFLVGWDNLYPELNFQANFKRNLFAIWQEYRGLGLFDGMAHAANLPHTFFLWFLHFFLPLNLLRYFVIFLLHFLGGVGMFLLLKEKVLKNQPGSKLVSFLGSLFYLFNLGTIQMFFAPLEAFAFHFVALPWLTLGLLNFLEKPTSKNLFIFGMFLLISLPQAFLPQLFLVFLILVFGIFFVFLIKEGRKAFSKITKLTLLILAINSFWLAPYVFGVSGNTKTIIAAKINQMSSENIYLKNHARGYLKDVLLLRGFMLDVSEPDKTGQSGYIMQDWRIYLEKPFFQIPAFSFCFLGFLGLGYVLIRKKIFFVPFVFCFLLAFFFLGNNIWGLEFLNQFLREKVPILAEAFRFPFTKLIILFAFCWTIFLSLGLVLFFRLSKRILRLVVFTLFLLLISAYTYPAFEGHFLFESLRLPISSSYFQTFKFFQNQDKNSRIISLPSPSFWNWRFHENGYRGSGFLWYGLEQPMLDRAFDPWSSENENFYWEISYALYSQNLTLFENLLEKYQINWILLDENVIKPDSMKALYIDETKRMLSSPRQIYLAATFDKIQIYKVNLKTPVSDFVFLGENLPVVQPSYEWNNFDQAYLDQGGYFSNSQSSSNYPFYYYPFRSLFTGRSQGELEFEIEENENFFLIKKELPKEIKNRTLVIPEIKEELVWVNSEDLTQKQVFLPEVYSDGQTLSVIIPKVKGYFSSSIQPTNLLSQAKNCQNQGEVKNEFLESENLIRLEAIDATNCSAIFWLPNLPHNLSYLVTVQSRNIVGKPIQFWLENLDSHKADIDTHLPDEKNLNKSFLIQPAMTSDGLGYTLHFDSISLGLEKTTNDLGEVSVYPFPFQFLTSLKLVQEGSLISKIKSAGKISHPSPNYYLVKSDDSFVEGQTLILSQSFHSGWLAFGEARSSAYETDSILSKIFPFFGRRLENHVLVNNWENGWILKGGEKQIVILFWPQYLEFFGLFLLLGTTIFMIFRLLRESKQKS